MSCPRHSLRESRRTAVREFLVAKRDDGADRRRSVPLGVGEAAVLCVLGGIFGIVVGHPWSTLVGMVVGRPTVMSIRAPLVGIGVAASVGIIFGYYPARAASRLNPIDALRYE
jgi:macrolide transport system ATP-binding/permease protein